MVQPMQNATTTPELISRTKTADGYGSQVWTDGRLTSADSRPWTMHRRTLPVSVALVVHHEVCLFDASEMPHLIAAALDLHKRGDVTPGELRTEASRRIASEAAKKAREERSAKYRADVAAGRREPDRSGIAMIERDRRQHIEHCRDPWCKCR